MRIIIKQISLISLPFIFYKIIILPLKMEDDDLVLVEEESNEIKRLLKENNDLIKGNFKNREIFFLPADVVWPFPSITIPVPSEESYNNTSSIEIIDLVKRALALMTPYDQRRCVKTNHKKERLILANYVNRLYNMKK